jgi:Purple acid Phosphatase, N-terminal domain
MNKVLLVLFSVILSSSVLAQESPTTAKAARVQIIQGPEIALASWFTVIRWTTNNPGGSPVHYGIVHYGTNPKDLSQTAKNPMRLNPYHSSTVFRVHLYNLKPRTTYYYTVDSMESTGQSDGVKSPVKSFTTLSSDQAMAVSPPAARSTAKMRPSIQ